MSDKPNKNWRTESKQRLKEFHAILDEASRQVKSWPKWMQRDEYRFIPKGNKRDK